MKPIEFFEGNSLDVAAMFFDCVFRIFFLIVMKVKQ